MSGFLVDGAVNFIDSGYIYIQPRELLRLARVEQQNLQQNFRERQVFSPTSR